MKNVNFENDRIVFDRSSFSFIPNQDLLSSSNEAKSNNTVYWRELSSVQSTSSQGIPDFFCQKKQWFDIECNEYKRKEPPKQLPSKIWASFNISAQVDFGFDGLQLPRSLLSLSSTLVLLPVDLKVIGQLTSVPLTKEKKYETDPIVARPSSFSHRFTKLVCIVLSLPLKSEKRYHVL